MKPAPISPAPRLGRILGKLASWRPAALRPLLAPFKLTPEQLLDLLSPFNHSIHVRRHAAEVIISRVQFVSTLFAILLPLWSVVDLWMFEGATAWGMVMLRLIAAGIFLALAWPRSTSLTNPYLQAMVMLLTMLLVPPFFYLMSLFIIDDGSLTQGQALLVQLYAFMPTVVLGGLAIFPLTALEALALAVPAVLIGVLGLVVGGETLSLQQHGPALWFMLMMLGVAMFSGMSQLHYMATLVSKAMTDPLTGSYTRRSGTEALDLMFRLSSMSGKPMAVMFFDIDHFKAINDDYGHEAGDQALRVLTESLRASLRRSDILIRWGGEEFIAVLPDMPAHQLQTVLRRIHSHGLGQRPEGAPLTASIGIAENMADNLPDWPALVDLADRRMYDAKHGGRNRAVIPGETMVELTEEGLATSTAE